MGIATDALALVTGFGSVLVVHATGTTRGLLDDAEQQVLTGDGTTALMRSRVLLVAVAALPDLAAEDSLSVGALGDDTSLTAYRVTDIRRQADGVLWEVAVVP